MKINENYLKLKESYLFSTVAKKVEAYKAANPATEVLRLGIGDVTKPLTPSVIAAMHKATDEMAAAETFRGYGPEQGYDFLRDTLKAYYSKRGVALDFSEIFISDGAKSDFGNFLDILSNENRALIPDPVYPAYLDVNIMLGRQIDYAEGNKANGFKPAPNLAYDADIIYICSPNNPTGAVYDKKELKAWVDYANKKKALILFDAAYEAFISEPGLPHSIYEIDGARTCAIEISSLSKTAGFTGTRCGYTVVPHELKFGGTELNALWVRRQSTKFNGVPYVVQRAAEAVFTEKSQAETGAVIAYYMENARTISAALTEKKIWHTGGKNSPYIWLECPGGMKSWEFFDFLLERAHVVGTPGAGFGKMGEGYFRLTGFGSKQTTEKAVGNILKLL
ncbi:MAG: LL-diaminopimelate aminotransferase [Clostridiaceae bacterium]|jgi:LL-diaminopimelate aminotransferase|nr:LL-diaminopimelate aminotransferase [Clostridiaceae bacterium]